MLLPLLVCSCYATAQGGPPLLTDDPGTPGNRHWEINTALTLELLKSQRQIEAPLLDLNYGAGDHVQLKFELPWAVRSKAGDRSTGLGNSKLGLKWRFLDQEKRGFALSTYPQFTFNNPTSSVARGLAEPGWQMLLPIELSRTMGKFALNGEIGYTLEQERPNQSLYGFAAGYEHSDSLELLAEVHALAVSAHDRELVFDLGTRRKLTRLSKLLLAAGRSLPRSSEGEPRFFMYLGIQLAF